MLDKIVEPLLKWYDANARILPWREEPSPYRVWVSEIMLQQTRVQAVKPFFERFITALPTIKDLAECDEIKLMKLWEGLGYYNRVRNMQIAAKSIMEEFGGEMPDNYKQVLSLKGIGSYTAGAVSSIAFQIAVPAVDGNVLRVISRVIASYEDILKASVKKQMEDKIAKIIPLDRPGDFNQALMELGAMICIPNGMPNCEMCPLEWICKAHEMCIVTELPKKTQGKARKIEDRTVLIIKDGDKVLLQKRPLKGLLAGLYEFPNVLGHYSNDEVLALLKEKQLSPLRIQRLRESKHIFSHLEWRMIGYVIKVEEMTEPSEFEYMFVDTKEAVETYAIPAAFQAYTRYINIRLGEVK